jgi:hypothetical protein
MGIGTLTIFVAGYFILADPHPAMKPVVAKK